MRAHLVVFLALAATAAAESCHSADCSIGEEDHVALLQEGGTRKHVIKAPSARKQSKAKSDPIDVNAAIAEFVAMTLFVIIGVGSAMGVAKATPEGGWVCQVSLSFGLAITALAYSIGHYSGGQINCAVTFGLVIAGELSATQGLLNFAAQVVGAILGAIILTMMHTEGTDATGGLGCNAAPEGGKMRALVGEIMMTCLLIFVVLETAVNPASEANRQMACLAIGFAVFLAHTVLIPIDGCSINPTRSLGPALVRKYTYKNAGSMSDMWIFWVGPLAGAALGAGIHMALRAPTIAVA